MRAGLIQLSSGPDPVANLAVTRGFLREAAAAGVDIALTPEVTNIVTADRAHLGATVRPEAEDPTLAALRHEARALGIWLVIGSLALKTGDPDGRFANRSFVVTPTGEIVARYDKIHMFDVEVSETERYRESATFRPGDRAVLADTPLGRIGLSVCYDLRFAPLYRRLAKAGAQILTVPAAFTRPTGQAHWEVLLRARAIETGSFVLAPAQTGENAPGRATHGHSLAVAPWGEVLADAGTEPGLTLVDFDLASVDDARARIPALSHDRDFQGP
ncbi:MAG: carbon-nitrogen hydrolase family protein [Maritimibacter sp.]|nr:carbon-nitrogen hydrolase family protein [Maritimibacter sp.]MCB2118720.1 carbon-nitrogen hydrolase family protein [Paracoccaceae bacterium]